MKQAISRANLATSGMCVGCGGCVDRPDAGMAWDRYGQWKPDGPRDWLTAPDARLARTCPFSPTARNEDAIAAERFPHAPHHEAHLGRYVANYVGHADEDGFRMNGSSGGMVTWAAAELLRTGAVDAVAHVVPMDPDGDGRFFGYRLSRSVGELGEGAKSRYYPVELSGVLDAIRRTPGRYAVVGIPCFIKAVHLARAEEPVLAERIVHALGLFCGHMKSARLVDSFAWQTDAQPEAVRSVEYRLKDADRPANWYTAHLRLKDGSTRTKDWWHLADGDWGSGFFQNAACNWCDDVVAETADIAFGDAWVEPYSSDGRGTNVVVVRHPLLHRLIETARSEGRLALDAVEPAFIVGTQAAGFRHRREGLGYRLTWAKRGLRPVKRVAPGARGITARRRAVYRTRFHIARWSHRWFLLSDAWGVPALYVRWGHAMRGWYAALTWSQGRLGRWFDRLEGKR